MGDQISQPVESMLPIPAINSVARTPIASASSPPASAPSGATPAINTCIAVLVRPSSRSGAMLCRKLTAVMKERVLNASPHNWAIISINVAPLIELPAKGMRSVKPPPASVVPIRAPPIP